MAMTYSAKGTSHPSFTIGKKGSTIYQGISVPQNGDGTDGDIYVQMGPSSALWQKVTGTWNKIGNFGSKIFTTNTTVDTAQVADTIVLTANGSRVLDIAKGNAAGGERIRMRNDAAAIVFETLATGPTDPVDIVFDLHGTGSVRIQGDGPSMMTTDAGSSIVLQPGATTGDAGLISVRGGDTTKAATRGGNVELTPGTGPSGLGQILAPTLYAPTDQYSLVTKKYVDDAIAAALTP